MADNGGYGEAINWAQFQWQQLGIDGSAMGPYGDLMRYSRPIVDHNTHALIPS